MLILMYIWLLKYANTVEINSKKEGFAGIENHVASENKEIKRLSRNIREMLTVMHRSMIYLKRQNIYST